MIDYFEYFKSEVSQGLASDMIPMGLSRLSAHIGIRKAVYYLIGGYTGCLAADTVIDVGRRVKTANTKPRTIEELYNKFHGVVSRDKWGNNPTKVKVFKPNEGVTGLHEIETVVKSGIKEVYEVTTETGKIIKATMQHRFMCTMEDVGERAFKRLSELNIGDTIVCKSPKHSRAKGRKLKNRKDICGKYPYYHTARKVIVSGHEYQRIYLYRLAYDAYVNNISISELLFITCNVANHNLKLLPPEMIVHHIDENPLNNEPENLIALSKADHDRLHAKTSNYGHSWVQYEKIVSIEYAGAQMTYDIVCKDPYHNFVANGFVVHNSAKTTLLDDAFVLNPFDWYMANQNSNVELKIFYFSMERRRNYKIAKWIGRKIFLTQGVIIPVNRIMGWVKKELKLTLDEQNLLEMYRDYINTMLNEVVYMKDGPVNPMAVKTTIDDYAKSHGKVERISQHQTIYVPDHPNRTVLIIYDHDGLQRKEKREDHLYSTKKEILDLSSADARNFRDFYGFSPVKVSQFNRDIASPMRLKNGDVEPMLEDFKDTGGTQEDADVVMSLFDPMRYKVPCPSGYNLERLRDSEGKKYYRSLKILKNSYGSDDIRIGLALQPEVGVFKEMPKKSEITDEDYGLITSSSYFLL